MQNLGCTQGSKKNLENFPQTNYIKYIGVASRHPYFSAPRDSSVLPRLGTNPISVSSFEIKGD